ncbi:MAG: recombinase family protein [Mesorhizobium sp.]|nr:recombinase family protein [Mesorhizobium sp.]
MNANPRSIPASRPSRPHLRCAIYTRKSTEEGLDQEFNSLDAQREACAAYIVSQIGLGWKPIPDRYDDGGISGGTMERPALQRLLQDIRDRKVDVVVVYKIDRLTRALADFAKIVEVFDGNGVSFVSVTQQFNTTTSMGRLTLNVLLSFAQFEREVTAERIRDKIAASRKKGMWMGGTVPLGYYVQNRKLLISEPEASFVRSLFSRYLEVKSAPKLAAQISREANAARMSEAASSELDVEGGTERADQNGGSRVAVVCNRYGTRPMSSGMLYKLLANPLYIGKVRHKDDVYDGEHEAIIEVELFDAVQKQLAMGAPVLKGTAMNPDAHLLTGILYDDTGDRMSPTHGTAHGRRYRYYVSSRVRRSADAVPDSWRIAATDIEKVVLDQAVQMVKDHSRIARWIEDHASPELIQIGLQRVDRLVLMLGENAQPDRLKATLRLMFRSITLSTTAIRFEVNAKQIVRWLVNDDGDALEGSGRANGTDDGQPSDTVDTTIIELPLSLRRRGVGMRIVIDSPYARPDPDLTLVDLVARAHVYLDKLTGLSAMGTTEIASVFGVNRADVGRILPLAFLSPQMLDAILAGRQSASLTARRLARMDVPSLWAEQEAALQ